MHYPFIKFHQIHLLLVLSIVKHYFIPNHYIKLFNTFYIKPLYQVIFGECIVDTNDVFFRNNDAKENISQNSAEMEKLVEAKWLWEDVGLFHTIDYTTCNVEEATSDREGYLKSCEAAYESEEGEENAAV